MGSGKGAGRGREGAGSGQRDRRQGAPLTLFCSLPPPVTNTTYRAPFVHTPAKPAPLAAPRPQQRGPSRPSPAGRCPGRGDRDTRGAPGATHSTKAREQRQTMPPAAPARSSSSATSLGPGSCTIPAGSSARRARPRRRLPPELRPAPAPPRPGGPGGDPAACAFGGAPRAVLAC